MKTLFGLSPVITLAFWCLLSVFGCSEQGKDSRSGETDMPVGQRPNSVEGCLSAISNPKVSLLDVDFALAKLRESPEVNEAADFWVKIVEDPAFSVDHRGRCVSEYFRRHIKTPISVGSLGEMPGIRRWFRKETVSYAPRGNSPVDFLSAEESGYHMLDFVPDFISGKPAAHFQGSPFGMTCIKLSREVLVDQFLQVIQGKRSDPNLMVQKIGEVRHNTNLGCLHLEEP